MAPTNSQLFPKDSIEWLKWLQDGKAIRINQKEKVQQIIDSQRTTNTVESERIGLNLNDVAKVVENFENPTVEDEELFRPGDFSPRDRVFARYAEHGIETEYAAEGALNYDNDIFNAQLQLYIEGNLNRQEPLLLGKPKRVMKFFLPSMPIIMRQCILHKASEKKHNMALESLIDMSTHISNPIFVFQRFENTIGILTEMKDREGKNICVAIEMNKEIQKGREVLMVNDIRSVHGRETQNIIEPILQNGTLKYVDKEKGLEWLSSASSSYQQEIAIQDLNSVAKVVENFENPTKVQQIIDSLRMNPGEAERIGLNLDDVAKVVENFENPTVEDEELFRPGDFSPRDRVFARYAYESIVRSGSYRSILGEAADVAKQSELKVGNYAPTASDIAMASEATEVDLDDELFNEQIKRWESGQMRPDEIIRLSNPRGVMHYFLPNLPIVMRQRILSKASVKKHNVEVAKLADMPRHLSNPIFVFKRADNVLGVLTEMQDRDGKNICVAIELTRSIQKGGEVLEVNDIRSVHGRNVADIIYPILQNGTLQWVDKKKGLNYLSSASRYVQQEIGSQDLEAVAKIVENFENPTVEDEELFRPGDFSPRDRVFARYA